MLHAPINVHEYCAMDVDNRYGNTKYNFSLFQKIQDDIFSKKDTKRMDEATRRFLQKSKNVSKTLKQKELERFVIELSWKSSKIEGNTYTLLDTERLVKEGIQAPGHSKDEATMIMNHKKSFQYIVENLQEFKNISARNIEDIHRMLVEGLKVSFGLRTRQVGVTGSCYVPLSIASQIKEALEDVCKAVRNVKSPYAKALVALVGISYIQPFEDGNKRTARLITNAILMAHGCAPLSYRNVDEVLYHESMLVFYEKNSLASIQEICMDQYIFSCDQYLKFSA
jgi:Fic family protein